MFRDEDRARQLIDFTGLQAGTIRPTDVDFIVEFFDRSLLVGDLKFEGNENAALPTGQQLLLERLVRAWRGPFAVAFVAGHNTPKSENVLAKDAKVRQIYLKSEQRWRPPTNPETTIQNLFEYTAQQARR